MPEIPDISFSNLAGSHVSGDFDFRLPLCHDGNRSFHWYLENHKKYKKNWPIERVVSPWRI